MTTTERREEILRMLVSSRHEQVNNLAALFDVNERTIRNDITALSASYPIYTVQGNGGGIFMMDNYHPYKNVLSQQQTKVLEGLLPKANDEEQVVLENLLREYSGYANYPLSKR